VFFLDFFLYRTYRALLGIRLRKLEMRQFLCVRRVMGCGWVLHLEIK